MKIEFQNQWPRFMAPNSRFVIFIGLQYYPNGYFSTYTPSTRNKILDITILNFSFKFIIKG